MGNTMAKISDIRLDMPVEIYPCRTEGVMTVPLDTQVYVLSPDQASKFISELKDLDKLSLVEETLQGLAERNDGTKLKTAFPSVDDFIEVARMTESLPTTLLPKIAAWKREGATEINIDFEEKP
tara:strand:+ start:491 stop:862 length:372 start_codon:yes stop_codon:yes gene_type:complete